MSFHGRHWGFGERGKLRSVDLLPMWEISSENLFFLISSLLLNPETEMHGLVKLITNQIKANDCQISGELSIQLKARTGSWATFAAISWQKVIAVLIDFFIDHAELVNEMCVAILFRLDVWCKIYGQSAKVKPLFNLLTTAYHGFSWKAYFVVLKITPERNANTT